MNCLNPSCKSDQLLCRVSAILMAPLAKRGGTLSMKGVTVGQAEIKAWWDKNAAGTEERKIRGPIVCAECDTEHVYIRGLQPSLRMITYDEACEKGYDHFASISTKSSEDDE